MASISSTSPARDPLAAVSDNKRSAEDISEDDVKPSAKSSNDDDDENLSPYKKRIQLLEQCCQDNDKILFYFFGSGELLWKTGKLRELGVDDEESMSDAEKEAAYDSLTQEQIDENLKVMVVEDMFSILRQACYRQILYADPRNEEEDDILVLNRYSSEYMFPVMESLLKTCTKQINSAKRAVQKAAAGNEDTSDYAMNAFNSTFATVLACDAVDQWREYEYMYPEDCQDIAKKVSKVCSELLWFNDYELGFEEPFSRKVMLEKLETIHKDWNRIGGVKYKTVRNGEGLGRLHAPPPPPKKGRRTNAVPVVANSATNGSDNNALVDLLNAVQGEKKKMRARTCLQLKIASVSEPEKSALVLVSGMTNMKKINQFCAYVTGHSYNYDYSSQRGASIKGSRIELQLEASKMWLAPNGLSKQAAAQGAALFEDRPVRIIQVFQGLNTSSSSGIVYDSDEARALKVYWVTPNDERYEITAQAIVANKCTGQMPLLPRFVAHLDSYNLYGYVPNLRTGFGKSLYGANNYLQGDREGREYLVSASLSPEDREKIVENSEVEPIANEDGTIRESRVRWWYHDYAASAGLPTPTGRVV